MSEYKELLIFVSEDENGQTDLIKESLKESGICNQIIKFSNDEDQWHFFKESHDISDTDNSDNLVLDYKMSKFNSYDTLKKIQDHCLSRKTPVILLTPSEISSEAEYNLRLDCNMYLIKRVNYSKFSDILSRQGLTIKNLML